MPDYKLVYFNAKGRAELIRWIFAYSGIPYEDERIEMSEWPEIKAGFPGGKLPVLMVDEEEPLPQSLAIARYVAKEAGLVPEDHLEAAFCDALVDTLSEIMEEAFKIIFSSDDEEGKMKRYNEELFPKVVSPVMKRLEKRLGENEWLVSDEASWADLFSASLMLWLQEKYPETLSGFPALQEHVRKVVAFPKVKQWVENQPKSLF